MRLGHQPSTYRVLQITDWHLDLEYQPGTVKAKCGREICCHEENGIAIDGIGARKFGETTGCDLPYNSCQGQIEWLKENLRGEMAPDLILWTGDSVSHDMQHMTEETILETLKKLTNLIQSNFPDVPLIVNIGNHDFEPANYQNFKESSSEYLQKVGTIWHESLGDSFD